MTSPDDVVAQAIADHQNQSGALLPLLHAIQDALGYIPDRAIARIAQALHRSRAEVHGVITFFHHFRTQPPARHVLQMCRAEACQSMGSEALWQHACRQLQIDAQDAAHGATAKDVPVHLEPVYCLGLCSTAPSLAFDTRPQGRVQCADLDRLLATVRTAA